MAAILSCDRGAGTSARCWAVDRKCGNWHAMSLSAAAVTMLLLSQASPPPEDARCRGGILRAAKRFKPSGKANGDEAALREPYRAFLEACGQGEVVSLTSKLIGFKTVSAAPPAQKAPQFAAMATFLRGWSRQHGLAFRVVGKHDVFEVTWGSGRPQLGLVFHGDVVPPDRSAQGAKTPFVAEVRDGRLHGRGAQDDKGPLAAAMVSVAMAKAIGLEPAGEVRLMVGNGEESDWAPMRAYAQNAPPFVHVVSVDAGFPVVGAQSGSVTWELIARVQPAGRNDDRSDGGSETSVGMDATPGPGAGAGARWVPVDVAAGQFLTQVPGEATLTVQPTGISPEAALQQARSVLASIQKKRPSLQAEAQVVDGRVVLTTRGRAVHSSSADRGHNALWDLAVLAEALPLEQNGIGQLLSVLATRFADDHHGRKLGLFYEHPVMGALLVAPTVLQVVDGRATLRVNMRRPAGQDATVFNARLDEAAAAVSAQTNGAITEVRANRKVSDPHLADLSGPLVTTLLDIYRSFRPDHKDAKPIAIRGGTYARLFPRAVDFGPSFPGEPYTGHSAQESISIERLHEVTQMLGEVLIRLAVDPPAADRLE